MPDTSIYIDALTSELRIARVKNEVLMDIQIHRPDQGPRTGDIILGRVKAVVPGIRGAFVDIGDTRDGFLPFADKDTNPPVSEGEAVMVQVRGEAMADKGARLTTNLSLTGRYAVYTPGRKGINVSRKGHDPDLADQFRDVARELCQPEDGVIVRTRSLVTGEGALAAFASEVSRLRDQWAAAAAVRVQGQQTPPVTILPAPGPVMAAVLALDAHMIDRIVVEGIETWTALKKHVTHMAPELVTVLHQYTGSTPLYETHGLEQQLDAVLGTEVTLPSGGRLHIMDTPACVSVDVDSAGASVSGSRRDVIRCCNQEAAVALARELRVRNLSGNIIVDFISSNDRGDGAALLKQLARETADDPAPIDVKGFSRLGFVEMIRRKRSPSLAEVLCTRSTSGDGAGRLKSAETIAFSALRRAYAAGRSAPGRPITIHAHAQVIAILNGSLRSDVKDNEDTRGTPLILCGHDDMPLESLDVYAEA